MKHVYGPVTSRRLGRSLGIDPLPMKTCNFSCVYCQLGRTRPFTCNRHAFFSATEIFAEIATTMGRLEPGAIDWITFVGSGETTLFSRLGSLIEMVRSITDTPIAVITNGSLLHVAKVRRELATADAVLPSLDAGNELLFQKINRPYPSLNFGLLIEGLSRFREEFAGKLWVEVMLIRNLNDSDGSLADIAAALDKVQPDEVHLSTPTRPPAEPWVEPPDQAALTRAIAAFGSVAKVLQPVDIELSPERHDNLVEALLAVVSRHPLRETEVIDLLERWRPGRTAAARAVLRDSGQFQIVERFGVPFWCPTGCVFHGPVSSPAAVESPAADTGHAC